MYFSVDVFFSTLVTSTGGNESFKGLAEESFSLLDFALWDLVLCIFEDLLLIEAGLDHLLDDELTSLELEFVNGFLQVCQ